MEYTAPLICAICQDFLVSVKDVKEVVATPCGHVFHKPCVVDWFKRKCPKKDSRSRIRLPEDETLKGQCPICTKPGWMKECLKLYLNVDEDEVNLVNELQSDVGNLTQELNEAKKKLEEAQEVMDKQKELIVAYQKQLEKMLGFKTGTLRACSIELKGFQERAWKMDGAK